MNVVGLTNYNLVIIGSIGYDVYITGGNNKIIFAPGGFAWHCASGILSVDAKATVLANITRGFNRNLLKRFKNTKINVAVNNSSDIFENAYIFDFSIPNYTSGISYSEGIPDNKFSSFLKKFAKTPQIIHVGTTNPGTILIRILDIEANVHSKVKFSSNIYLPYITKPNLPHLSQIIKKCSILFMNYEELLRLRKFGLQSLLKNKLLFVTCGKIGTAVFKNGKLASSQLITPKSEVSAIGAGDVFIGACLACLVKGYDLFSSLVLANNTASNSVTAYGTSHVKRIYSPEILIKRAMTDQKIIFRQCTIESFRKATIFIRPKPSQV